MDFAKLKKVQANLDEGDKLFLFTKSLTAETDIRLCPPNPNLDGLYFLEVDRWWIGKKSFISHKTFGMPCVIEEELNAAKAETGDPELQKLANNTTNGVGVSNKIGYFVPLFQLKATVNAQNEVENIDVVGETGKILDCGPQIMGAINAIVSSKNYQNGTPDGACDAEKGWNMTIGKTGTGLDTEYKVVAWGVPTPLDPKYNVPGKIPDTLAVAKKMMKSNDYLRSVIRNYLYGEAILAETPHVFDGTEQTTEATEKVTKNAVKTTPVVKTSLTAASKTVAKTVATPVTKAAVKTTPVIKPTATGGKGTTSSLSAAVLEDDDN